ncbi:MAG: VWA domain-containing protein [Sulfurifustaceae bacterium]
MTFLWPQMLWLLLALPLLVAGYLWLLRRRKKAALAYASLSLVKEALSGGRQFRRHVPPVLFLLALAALLVATARPATVITLPSQKQTIILAMDISGSMRASDVKPSRLEAAQTAAKAFVGNAPRATRLGVVAFAGTASVVQAPTENRDDVVAAIDRLQLQRATAIGSGILVSLTAIFPDIGVETGALLSGREPSGRSLDDPVHGRAPDRRPVAPGSYTSAAIILLTDGQTTMGLNPVEAAKIAADRGVRVYTVGIGTPDGEVIHFEGWSMRVQLDEDTLKRVADLTRAEYFYAGNATDLKKVYETLSTRFVLEKKESEVTALFSAAGALLAIASALLSLLWFNRIF